MQQNFLHFLSDSPCNLECNGEKFGLIDNENTFELDLLTKTNHVFINYIPISQSIQSIPYTFKLDTSETPSTDNNYIKIVPFPNNNYDIIMKPFYYYQVSNTNVLFNGKVNNFFISITNSNTTNIIVYSGSSMVFNKNSTKLTNVKIENKNDTLIFTGIIDDKNYYLLIVDSNTFKILFEEIIQSIEDSSNGIITYQKSNTLCRHGKVCNFNFTNKESNNYYVYDNSFQIDNVPTILIPQALLECVKISDEKSCKIFLDNKYNSTSISQIKSYFGDIEEIYLNRHQTFSNKINYTIKANKFKNFNFLIDNNKIYDIEEIF